MVKFCQHGKPPEGCLVVGCVNHYTETHSEGNCKAADCPEHGSPFDKTTERVNNEIREGDEVIGNTRDRELVGTVIAVIKKLNGDLRYVVEDRDGLLMIFPNAEISLRKNKASIQFIKARSSAYSTLCRFADAPRAEWSMCVDARTDKLMFGSVEADVRMLCDRAPKLIAGTVFELLEGSITVAIGTIIS